MEKVKHILISRNLLVCAFCTHWYDPTNSHIKPVDQFRGFWDYDYGVKSYCEIRRRDVFSDTVCTHFERKIPKQ